jgi:sarcosine oxidase
VRTDVVVAGLGSMGAAGARELARRGVRVVGIDRFIPPHSRGEHTGGSRIIRSAYAEGEAYVPLVRRSYELWRSYGDDLLTMSGGLNLGLPDSATVSGALASARAHGLAHEPLDAHDIRRRFPPLHPADDEVGVFEAEAGIVRPEAAIARWLADAAQAGARLMFGRVVTGWRPTAEGVEVELADGEQIRADHLVLAPGPWAADLLGDVLARDVRVESRIQHYWVSPPGFRPGRFPVWIWEPPDDPVAYGMPAFDAPPGEGVDPTWPVVKAAFHHVDRPADPDVGAPAATCDDVEAITAWLRPRIPTLAAAPPSGTKPCLYTVTPDEHFLLGPHPVAPAAVSVAAGFSGHGFKFAPVIGEILADLAQQGRTRHDIALFAPLRFTGRG